SRFPALGEGDFLLAVLNDLRKNFKTRAKILLTGYSRGGQFTHRFAFAHPELVLAAAPCSSGTWTTPDGRLLIETYGQVEEPEKFLSNPANREKIPERLLGIFNDERVAGVAGLKAMPDAQQVPFLVMCGSLDTRFGIAQDFARSLSENGFSVETEWPRTPHGSRSDPEYAIEFEKYSVRVVDFFVRQTESN
ncbi:MAG: hypothetical protein KJT03_23035, partial [Verrucomicrobiae bacterium]|nr:hypothetical protein [Verrucomicrobiae bacterium]